MTLILVQYYLRYGPKQPHAPRQLGKKTEAQALQAVCEPSASTGEHAPGDNRNQLVDHNAYGLIKPVPLPTRSHPAALAAVMGFVD